MFDRGFVPQQVRVCSQSNTSVIILPLVLIPCAFSLLLLG